MEIDWNKPFQRIQLDDDYIRIICYNNECWFSGKDVAIACGYKHSGQCIRNLHTSKIRFNEIQKHIPNNITVNIDNNAWLIDLTGLKILLQKSRKYQTVKLAQMIGLDIVNAKLECVESETTRIIMFTFQGIDMIPQFKIHSYFIDLYSPTYKIAIECDENGHKNRDASYEIYRQKTIEKMLNCKFIRYNPHDKDFNMYQLLNKIFTHIIAQQK